MEWLSLVEWTTSEWCIWNPLENLRCTVCHQWSLTSSLVTRIYKMQAQPSSPLCPPHLLSCQACASPDWFIKTYAHTYHPVRDILGSQELPGGSALAIFTDRVQTIFSFCLCVTNTWFSYCKFSLFSLKLKMTDSSIYKLHLLSYQVFCCKANFERSSTNWCSTGAVIKS